MKHRETADVTRYIRDHLVVSHGWSRAEVYALKLAELMEKHVELHPNV